MGKQNIYTSSLYPYKLKGSIQSVQNHCYTVFLSGKLERNKLSIANQTLAMILNLLSIMSKDGVLLFTRINVT